MGCPLCLQYRCVVDHDRPLYECRVCGRFTENLAAHASLTPQNQRAKDKPCRPRELMIDART
jgi:hypothetical protein